MNRLYTDGTDRWLTPPELVEALGPFAVDPCAEPVMPWRTAATMIALPLADPAAPTGGGVLADVLGDGLAAEWRGIAFMNHPYSRGLPWAEKFVAHRDGIALTASKSLDTRWGQLLLRECGYAYFLAGRISFRYPDGSESKGKWLPNALWSIGARADDRLRRLALGADDGTNPWRGVLTEAV